MYPVSWLSLFLLIALVAAETITINKTIEHHSGHDEWIIIKPGEKNSNAGIVKYINSKSVGFKAALYPMFEGITLEKLKNFVGTDLNDPRIKDKIAEGERLFHMRRALVNSTSVKKRSKRGADPDCIPKNFDARKKWPYCKDVIEDIQEQAACGSCWAVSTAAMLTDRRCIASKGKLKERLSAWDLVECCVDCRSPMAPHTGCKGGDPLRAAEFYAKTGVCTGDRYKAGGCKPYPVAPNGAAGSEFGNDENKALTCQSTCQASYSSPTYPKDKHTGANSRILPRDLEAVQREIMTNGPIVNGFKVFQDFTAYKSGIYRYETGRQVGGHATKIIGWGEEAGKKYWLVVNSWGKTWGIDGMFKVVRGENHVGFEEFLVAVDAKPA